MKYILLFLISFCTSLYAYDSKIIEECQKGYIQSCLALVTQAKTNNDDTNTQLYYNKTLNILENACKKDYQSCLTLARITNPSMQEPLLQTIQKNKELGRIPMHTDLTEKITQTIMFDNTNMLKNLIATNTNETKAIQYQEKANSLLEFACYNHDVLSCILLSYIYEHGIGAAQNRPKATRLITLALEFATKNCILGENAMCALLNNYPEYIQNLKEDIDNIERKCLENDSIACFQSSLYHTESYYTNPTQVITAHNDKSDFIKAAQSLQRACQIDRKSCQKTLFNLDNVQECLENNNMDACAKTQKVEFLTLSCENGNLTSCYDLRHLPSFNETKRYIKLLQRVCRGGIIEACTELADMYQNGKKVTKNEEKAFSFIQRACTWSMKQQKNNNLCYLTGIGYENGEYIKQDLQKALIAYQYACEISPENALACERLGMLYDHYKQNATEALKWHQRACQNSQHAIQSCLAIAQAYQEGIGLKQNLQEATKIYEKLLASNGSHKKKVYLALATIYAQDQLQNKEKNPIHNYAKALAYSKEACKLDATACNTSIQLPNLVEECQAKNQNSCYQIATLLQLLQQQPTLLQMVNDETLKQLFYDEKNNKTIKQTFQNLFIQACKEDVEPACIALQNLDITHLIAQDFQLQQSLCKHLKSDKNAKDICLLLAQNALEKQRYKIVIESLSNYADTKDTTILNLLLQAYFYTHNYKKVFELYQHIYLHKIPSDYYYLGQMYENGLEVPQSYTTAYNIYTLTQSAYSALGQARLYEHGLGVFANTIRAKELYEYACNMTPINAEELIEACLKAGNMSARNGKFRDAQQYYTKACLMGYEGNEISCDKNNFIF